MIIYQVPSGLKLLNKAPDSIINHETLSPLEIVGTS